MAIVKKRHHQWRERCQFSSKKPSMTQQSAKDAADVNYIVNRFQRTGEMPKNPRGIEGQYMDCTPFQGDITENYNNALDTSERIQQEMADAREAALEAAKKPVNRDPEDAPPADPPENSD